MTTLTVGKHSRNVVLPRGRYLGIMGAALAAGALLGAALACLVLAP